METIIYLTPNHIHDPTMLAPLLCNFSTLGFGNLEMMAPSPVILKISGLVYI